MGIGIVGVGSYLPVEVVTNDDVERETGYDRTQRRGIPIDTWAGRTHGGRERRRAAPDEATSDLATRAAEAALKDAGRVAADIDLLILATVSSDQRLPPSVAAVQHHLGIEGKFLQLDSACTGFLDALMVAHSLLATGLYQRAIAVCADVTAPWLAPDDWLTRTVFGDGAGAAVLEPVADGHGLLHLVSGSDGSLGHYVAIQDHGSRRDASDPYLRTMFKEVNRWGVAAMARTARQVCEEAGVKLDDVDWVVPHQASARMVRGTAEELGVDADRVVLTYPTYGNTVGSSAGIALDHHHRERGFAPGDLVLIIAVGAGMAWSGALYRWGGGARSR